MGQRRQAVCGAIPRAEETADPRIGGRRDETEMTEEQARTFLITLVRANEKEATYERIHDLYEVRRSA